MSIKYIFTFLLLAIISTYFAFLNPVQIPIHLTQTIHFKVSAVVFLLSSSLIGALVSAFVQWTHNIGRIFKSRRLKKQLIKKIEDRDTIDRLYEKGETHFHAGKLDKAQTCFEKILLKNPEHLSSLHHLGVIYRKCGKLTDAKRIHNKAISINPDNTRSLYNLAEDHMETNQADKAFVLLQKIKLFDQGALSPLYKLRDHYMINRNWDRASFAQKSILSLIQEPDALAKEQNQLSELLLYKAIELHNSGQTSEAIKELKRALRENNSSVPAYIALGDIYQEISDPKQAVKVWKSGLDNTGAPVCLQRIHKIYEDDQYFKDIVKMYLDAIKPARGKNQEILRLMLADLFLKNKKPNEALELLQKNDKICFPRLALLNKAYDALDEKTKAEQTSRDVFKQLQDSIQHYICYNCGNTFTDWKEHCPDCDSWDSLQQGILFYPPKHLPTESRSTVKAA